MDIKDSGKGKAPYTERVKSWVFFIILSGQKSSGSSQCLHEGSLLGARNHGNYTHILRLEECVCMCVGVRETHEIGS